MFANARARDDIQQHIESIREICEFQPEGVTWVTPVYRDEDVNHTGEIIDFRIQYANANVEKLIGEPRNYLVGKCIRADKVPDPSISDVIFEQCLQVYTSGDTLEYPYFSPKLNKFILLFRTKVRGGVLTSARNRTAEQFTRIEKEEQSRLLDSLIDNSPYGISLYESMRNENGEIVDFKMKLVNKKAAEITAFSLEELEKNTVKQLIAIRGHSGYFEICAEVVNTGKPKYLEYYSKARDQWIAFSIVKFGDGYLLNYIDITQSKRYQEEATRNANELDALFNGSVSAVYSAKVVRNTEGTISDLLFVRVNDAFNTIFAATREKVVGMALSQFSDEDHSTFLSFVEQVMATGKSITHELEYANPSRWFEFSLVKLDADMISVTLNDITPLKVAQQKLERSIADLKELNASLEHFTYAVSHDLKEPVRKIRVYTEQIKRTYVSSLGDAGLRHFDRLEAAADRMYALIENLLMYAHANQGLPEVEDVDLNELLEEVLADNEFAILDKSATIKVGKLPVLRGCKQQLQQVFQNLIGNALKYHKTEVAPVISVRCKLPAVELPAHFTVRAEQRGRLFFVIEVQDNGIGFEQKDSSRIFEVFTRLHGKGQYSGTGVGLSIVKKVIENHGGLVDAQSKPGVGSTFRIYLPLQ